MSVFQAQREREREKREREKKREREREREKETERERDREREDAIVSCVAFLSLPEHITNFSLYMAVLQLLRSTPLVVRHTVCQQVNSLLTLNPVHISEMASRPGWESLFLWLLCPLDKALSKKSEEQPHENGRHTPTNGSAVETSGEETAARDKGEEVPDVLDNSSPSKPEVEQSRPHSAEDNPTDPPNKEADTSSEVEAGIESIPGESTDQSNPSLEEEDFFHVNRKGKTYSQPYRQRSVQVSAVRSLPSFFQLSSEDDDTWRTFNIVTKTIGYILWHYMDQDKPPWMTWGHMFASIDDFSSSHKLIVPVHVIKQR